MARFETYSAQRATQDIAVRPRLRFAWSPFPASRIYRFSQLRGGPTSRFAPSVALALLHSSSAGQDMAKGIFGERLKRERELREVTLEEITTATRIGPRFLEALENEDWDKLPGGIFNRGFVRSVARYLGLDEEALLAEYDLAHGTQVSNASNSREDRIPSPPKWIGIAIFVGLVVLVIALITGGIYLWRHHATRHSAKTGSMVTGQSIVAPKNETVAEVERFDCVATAIFFASSKMICDYGT